MDINLWSLLTLLSKFIFYLGVAGAVGGWFCLLLLQRHQPYFLAILRYLRFASALGFFATLSSFFIQAGAVMDEGFAGLLDKNTLSILANSSVGSATLNRLIGFCLIILSLYYFQIESLKKTAKLWIRIFTALSGTAFLIFSFAQVGHMAEENVLAHFAISFHVLTMSLWMGSLYPLWLISHSNNVENVQISMDKFGRIAAVIVGVLVLCGVYMAYIRVGGLNPLFTTLYGRGLLVKFLLVACLLLFAANNKWRLVPKLNEPKILPELTRAIAMEMTLGTLIFCITGIVTTLIGIE